MPVERPWVAENDAERERLRALVARLSDDELQRPLPGGWTVAAVLAHAGFWDARVIALLDTWNGGVEPSAADLEPNDVDWINDATRPLCLALPPRAAAELALQLAEQSDARVAAMRDAMLARFAAAGSPFNLARATHRREHLDEIESALAM